MKKTYQPSNIRKKDAWISCPHGDPGRRKVLSGAGEPSLPLNSTFQAWLSRKISSARGLGLDCRARAFVVICDNNDCGETRLGITVSGKVGNAVVRNRIKRLVREFFRRRRHELAPGLDILVIAKKTAAGVSLTLVENELGKSLGNHRSYAK
jgi:ribonuclease P protein component